MRPFTGMPLDRASSERKDPAQVQRLLRDPRTRAVAAGRDGVLVTGQDGSAPGLVRTKLAADEQPEPILLGLDDEGKAVFAVDLDAVAREAREAMTPRGAHVASLREVGAALPHAEAGLAAYVTALLNWHRRHRFCANCGAETQVAQAGYSRHCPRCQATHFPRTDPVVIMAVEHDGHLLLGRRAGWPGSRMSVLAGFISPGESAEEAVIREVHEESGIVARDPMYVSSQPWPFPASLMLGFEAQSDGGEPRAGDDELDDVRWFTLDEVRAAARDENPSLVLPPKISIARFLIERWVKLHAA